MFRSSQFIVRPLKQPTIRPVAPPRSSARLLWGTCTVSTAAQRKSSRPFESRVVPFVNPSQNLGRKHTQLRQCLAPSASRTLFRVVFSGRPPGGCPSSRSVAIVYACVPSIASSRLSILLSQSRARPSRPWSDGRPRCPPRLRCFPRTSTQCSTARPSDTGREFTVGLVVRWMVVKRL